MAGAGPSRSFSTRFAITTQRPVAILMIVTAVCVFGWVSYQRLSLDLMAGHCLPGDHGAHRVPRHRPGGGGIAGVAAPGAGARHRPPARTHQLDQQGGTVRRRPRVRVEHRHGRRLPEHPRKIGPPASAGGCRKAVAAALRPLSRPDHPPGTARAADDVRPAPPRRPRDQARAGGDPRGRRRSK